MDGGSALFFFATEIYMSFVDTAVACLKDGVNVEVVGRPGSGRSLLADRVVEALQACPGPVVRVQGVGALRHRPMAALVASVPGLVQEPSIGDAVDLLADELDDGGYLIVDDADDLDDVTAGVLVAVQARVRVPTLVGRRTSGRPPAYVRRLLAGSVPCVRHVLRPLTFDALRDVLEGELGAPIDTTTMASIATMSGGLPGMARSVCLVARLNGTLRRADGVWVAEGPLWSAELGQAVDALLLDATDEDVEALTLLAVAGLFSVRDARTLISPERLERLSELGLIGFVDGSDGDAVCLYPPVVGEYLRGQCTASARVSVRERLVAAGLAVPPSLEVDRRLPRSGADDAVVSHTLADHQTVTAQRLLAVWEDAPTATNAAPLLEALFRTSTVVSDPVRIMAHTDGSGCSDEANALTRTWYAVHRWVVLRDEAGGRELLDAVTRDFPESSAFARATRAQLGMLSEGITPQLLDSAAEVGETAPCGALVLAQGSAAAGQTGRAHTVLGDLDPEAPEAVAHKRVLLGLTMVLDGQVSDGLRWAGAGLADAQRDRATAHVLGHAHTVALASAIQGRFGRLERVASLSMTLTSTALLHGHFLPGVVGLAAARRRWAEPVATAGGGPCAVPCDGPENPYAFDVRSHGCTASWCHAQHAVRKGYLTTAAFAAVEAAEQWRDPEAFTVVEQGLVGLESPFLADLVRLAGAMVSRDADLLGTLVEAFADRGAWMYAARAGLQQAAALREAGDHAAAAAVVAALWNRVIPVTDGLEPLFARHARTVDLSPREEQVAGYAVAGRTAVDIAKALDLSVRTVEHHLFNTYRKVGVDSRDALRAALDTWLRSSYRPAPAPDDLTAPAARR